MRAARVALLGLAAGVLTGCKLGPNFVPPQEPVPDHYAGAPTDSAGIGGPQPFTDAAPESSWWREFQDAELNCLVDQTTGGTLDLQAAYLRIVEARIQVRAARAQGLPSLNGTASFTWEQLGLAGVLKSQKAVPPGSATSATTQQLIAALERPVDIYQVGFDASWELDLLARPTDRSKPRMHRAPVRSNRATTCWCRSKPRLRKIIFNCEPGKCSGR